jgi:hypothetical protein
MKDELQDPPTHRKVSGHPLPGMSPSGEGS